jgi:hypothetical protein
MFLKNALIFAIGYSSCFLTFYFRYKQKSLDTIEYDKTLIIISVLLLIGIISAYIID